MADILALAIIQREERRNLQNFVRPLRGKCFDLPENEFVSNFRLTKFLVCKLIEELRPYLEPRTARKNAFSTETKVFCTLSFCGSGSYQRNTGNDYLVCMPQRSVSKCIGDVAEAMNKYMLQKYIYFPSERSVQTMIKEEFYDYCGLNGVIGAIDCTHVAIVPPSNDGFHHEKNYVNRKGFHSINVQLVCDMQQKILNIVARFPGICHDSSIWRASNLRHCFHNSTLVHGNGWLLGDSGYPSEHCLHTPFLDAVEGSTEAEYNRRHARGRCVIERCNGTLKARFRCLLKDRTLHYAPEKAAKIINCCAILHNICMDANLEFNDHSELTEYDLPFTTGDGTQ